MDDVRLDESMQRLTKHSEDASLTGDQVLDVIRPSISVIERALRGSLVIPDFPAFCDDIREIYEDAKANEKGNLQTTFRSLRVLHLTTLGLHSARCTASDFPSVTPESTSACSRAPSPSTTASPSKNWARRSFTLSWAESRAGEASMS
jgi:hypothetical protein